MFRERALKTVLVVVGLLFTAGVVPLTMFFSRETAVPMIMSIYVTGFAHAIAMSILGLEIPSQRTGFLIGSAVLVVMGVALIALAPAKQPVEGASAIAA